MLPSKIVITLTPEQKALLYAASGKAVTKLGIEATETGAGWLCSASGNQFWLLKHSDPEAYRAARQKQQPRINTEAARFRLRIGPSRIHRRGVFAEERIPARRYVIEYTGELVNPLEAHRRTKDAKETYALALDKFWRIDGAVGGSGAEFINHSCGPNLRWRKFGTRIFCQSVRPIPAGEELTLDYHFSPKPPIVRCNCGSPQCRGAINFNPTKRRQHHGRK